MVKIRAGGQEKPEREEILEPLEEPTPERRKEPVKEPVPEMEPEKISLSKGLRGLPPAELLGQVAVAFADGTRPSSLFTERVAGAFSEVRSQVSA